MGGGSTQAIFVWLFVLRKTTDVIIRDEYPQLNSPNFLRVILDDDKNNGWTIEGGWAEEIDTILRNSQVGGSTYPIFFRLRRIGK